MSTWKNKNIHDKKILKCIHIAVVQNTPRFKITHYILNQKNIYPRKSNAFRY